MSREHKVTQVLKECLSSLTCHVAMIAHVSPASQHYTDTLGTVQFASRVHRIRRRRFKVSIQLCPLLLKDSIKIYVNFEKVDFLRK